MELRIPRGTLVIVCDARKALLLRNARGATAPYLELERMIEAPPNPASAAQGSDRPGRTQNVIGPTSAMETTDWHDAAEAAFARAVADAIPLPRLVRDGVILVAPPRMLAALRKSLGDEHRRHVLAEVDKDLTRHPVPDITRLLCGL